MDETLWALRKAIEAVDDELISLVVRRMRLAVRVANLKVRDNRPVRDAAREKQILDRICQYNHTPMTDEELVSLYKEIMKISRTVQERIISAQEENAP